MPGLEREIREVIEKAAIMDVLSRYAITVDSGDADGFADLFTADAVWEWPALGLRYEGRPTLRDLAAAIAELLPGGQHVTSNHVITIGRDHADAICELTCFISRPEKIHTVLQGFYRDRLKKAGSRWYIAWRRVEVRNPEIISQGEIGELYRKLTGYLTQAR
jgi:ketosteroid isomerase-like protein